MLKNYGAGILSRVEPDDELDKVLSNIEAKSIGALDRSKYHPASALGVFGSGTILPDGLKDGRSTGFDAKRPAIMRIGASTDGGGSGGFDLDITKLTAQEQNDCYAEADRVNSKSGQEAVALAAYALMAKVVKAKEKAAVQSVKDFRRMTYDELNNENSEPIPTAQIDSILDFVKNKDPKGGQMATPTRMRKVDFELPPPIRKFTCYYSDVVMTDRLLILVHNSQSATSKWFPSPNDSDEDTEETPLGVLVYDAEGQPDIAFEVLPTVAQFSYQGLDFCLLAIQDYKVLKEEQHEPAYA